MLIFYNALFIWHICLYYFWVNSSAAAMHPCPCYILIGQAALEALCLFQIFRKMKHIMWPSWLIWLDHVNMIANKHTVKSNESHRSQEWLKKCCDEFWDFMLLFLMLFLPYNCLIANCYSQTTLGNYWRLPFSTI